MRKTAFQPQFRSRSSLSCGSSSRMSRVLTDTALPSGFIRLNYGRIDIVLQQMRTDPPESALPGGLRRLSGMGTSSILRFCRRPSIPANSTRAKVRYGLACASGRRTSSTSCDSGGMRTMTLRIRSEKLKRLGAVAYARTRIRFGRRAEKKLNVRQIAQLVRR